MKKLFFLFLITFSINSTGQTLQGTVFDENKKPVMGVSIYLDGTTIETATDENGKYILNLKEKINTSLVIRFLGYETIYITDPFKNSTLKIFLVPKEIQLNEVVITKELFNRQQKLKVFREQFLGTSKAGKSCIISNEDIIDFEYDYETNTLNASANSPLTIKNSYLGYEIEFDLHEFYLHFYKKSIKSTDVIKSFFLGTTFYREITEGKKINKKRENIYNGSQMDFLKNLSENKWGKDDFLFFVGSMQANPELYFKLYNEENATKIILTDNQIDKVMLRNKPKFYAEYNLLYNKKEQSKIIFLTDTIYIDEFGNNSNAGDIEFSGAIGKKRLGDMLPMNYSRQIKN